jgi:hypothetical protein
MKINQGVDEEAPLDSSESISEMKKNTAIPVLKNSDRFINRPGESIPRPQGNVKPKTFSDRIGSKDPYQIAFQLNADINQVSSQVFQLWHKLIEIIIINPKFICEYMRMQYEEKMREHWGEHIYRTIIET